MTTIKLPYPPSANRYYRSITINGGARVVISSQGRKYANDVAGLLAGEQPHDGRLRVRVLAYLPDRRQRDLDNLLKPLLDACTKGGLWGDDKQIRDLQIVDKGVKPPNGEVIVEVEQMDEMLF